MKLTITTQSYLLAGSGEGAALIDSDAVFHRSGFPYLPSRRIKGLLRNSAIETLELISGKENQYNYLIDELFGKVGEETNNTGLKIPNLYLDGWEALLENYASLRNEYKHALSPTNIQHYFTEEIAQTAIQEDIAKKGSLRRYRVVKENNSFSCTVNSIDISKAAKALLYLAVANLQYMGSRRNRGFGKIQCMIEIPEMTVDTAIGVISESVSPHLQEIPNNNALNEATDPIVEQDICSLKQLVLSYKLTSPIMVTRQGSDQNTVNTDNYISGSRIRGLIASKLIQNKKLGKYAHLDNQFYNTILSEKVQFHHAWLMNDQNPVCVIPKNIQKEKGKDKLSLAFDVFRNSVTNGRSAGYLGFKDGANRYLTTEALKSTMFHHQRSNRVAGKSEDGNIFYYESLDAGQKFQSIISGPQDILEELKDVLSEEFTGTIGRSRSVQYSDVKIHISELQDIPNEDIEDNTDYLMICQTPLIVLNEFGMAEPTVSVLLSNLKKQIGIDAKVINAASAYDHHEHYVGVWKGKTPKISAFKEGTVFWLRFEKNNELVGKLRQLEQTGLGEMKGQGYGKVSFESYKTNENNKIEVLPYQDKIEIFDGIQPLPLLQEIIDEYNQQEKIIKLKIDAIKKAKGLKLKLTNSLVGRMEQLIKMSKNFKQFNNYVLQLKDKPAGISLEKAGLLVDLQKLKVDQSWADQQIYWSAFFQAIRNINKKEKTHVV
jgi:CRISPR-associated protein Csx10